MIQMATIVEDNQMVGVPGWTDAECYDGSSGQPFFYDFGDGMSFEVEVTPSIADRRDGKDVVFERAVALASEK
jgi:hypothetical protein